MEESQISPTSLLVMKICESSNEIPKAVLVFSGEPFTNVRWEKPLSTVALWSSEG